MVLLSDKFNSLCKWIRASGGFIGDVDMNSVNDSTNDNITQNINRFLTTKIPLFPNMLIASIPSDLCINGSTIHNDNLDSTEKILVHLILEIRKGIDSFYAPYLSLLPDFSEFHNYPLYIANEQTLKEWSLICPIFSDLIREDYSWLNSRFLRIKKEFPDIEDVEITYAQMVYWTRAWNVVGLIPLLDMINCCSLRGNKASAVEEKGIPNKEAMAQNTNETSSILNNKESNDIRYRVEMRANRNILANQEIFCNYGCYNYNTLRIYNFLEEHPCIFVDLNIPDIFSANSNIQNRLFELDKLNPEPSFISENGPNEKLLDSIKIINSLDYACEGTSDKPTTTTDIFLTIEKLINQYSKVFPDNEVSPTNEVSKKLIEERDRWRKILNSNMNVRN